MRRPLLSLSLALVALCAVPAVASASCAGASTAPSSASMSTVKSATLCLLNERRAQAGLPALGIDRYLDDASTRYSARMVAEHFFAHVAPDGSELMDRLRASGYMNGLNSWAVGENIAYGTASYATPASIVQHWMDSPPHRANILSGRYRAIGVGIALGNPESSAGATYTTDFGNALRSAGSAGAPVSAPPATTPVRHHAKHRRAKRALRSCRRARRGHRLTRAQRRRCVRQARRHRRHRH